ncbi:MAG: hypothetical protein M0R22_12680, partial [Dehalococcoidia bacterium]|nr:hypothetical protein [Dehalococcoidia bacterium]
MTQIVNFAIGSHVIRQPGLRGIMTLRQLRRTDRAMRALSMHPDVWVNIDVGLMFGEVSVDKHDTYVEDVLREFGPSLRYCESFSPGQLRYDLAMRLVEHMSGLRILDISNTSAGIDDVNVLTRIARACPVLVDLRLPRAGFYESGKIVATTIGMLRRLQCPWRCVGEIARHNRQLQYVWLPDSRMIPPVRDVMAACPELRELCVAPTAPAAVVYGGKPDWVCSDLERLTLWVSHVIDPKVPWFSRVAPNLCELVTSVEVGATTVLTDIAALGRLSKLTLRVGPDVDDRNLLAPLHAAAK